MSFGECEGWKGYVKHVAFLLNPTSDTKKKETFYSPLTLQTPKHFHYGVYHYLSRSPSSDIV